MAIGSRLRQLRRDQELTLDQVEAGAHVSQPYLSKIERDQALPNPETFERIASTLGVPEALFVELLDELRFERDRADLQKLGFPPDAAALAAAVNRLPASEQQAVVDAARESAPALERFLPGAKAR